MRSLARIKASKVRFVNLTAHDVNLGDKLTIPRGSKPARLLTERVRDGVMILDESGESMPIYKFDPVVEIVGLPDPSEGTVVIVSPMVRKELTSRGISRPDVVLPYAVESMEGRVQCAKALAR